MKKVMIKCFLTCTLFTCLLYHLSATPNLPSVEIVKANFEKKISFEAKGVEGDAKVVLQNEAGESLYTYSWTDQPELGKIFDLEQLPDGNYSLLFETDRSETLQPFSIERQRIRLSAADRVVRLVPLIKKVDQFIDVSWSNDRIGTIEVVIDDVDGATVMEEKLKDVGKLARRYDVSRLTSGSYLVKVITSEKTYYQELTW